jgi:hypothetical protein
MKFKDFAQLIAIGLQARVPMHMTGFGLPPMIEGGRA